MNNIFYQIAFKTLRLMGQPIGGIKPYRMYHWLGRKGWSSPEFEWYENRWGAKLLLSPHFYLDRNIIAFGEYDRDCHRAVECMVGPGMICLDIGANIGEISLHMAKLVGSSGRVYSFEPVPPVYERLSCHVEANNLSDTVSTYQLAMSNQNGLAPIRYADSRTENQGMGSLVRIEEEILTLFATVPTKTLDDFIAEHSVSHIDVIKMDVQGAEYMVIEGGQKTLHAFAATLFIEVSPIDLGFAGRTSRDLLQLLASLGYYMYEFEKAQVRQQIWPSSVDLDYNAENILCSKRQLKPGSELAKCLRKTQARAETEP